MNGVVLLDEEQQRTLYDSQRSSGPDSHRSRPPSDHRSEPRTDFSSNAEPRTDFTSRPSPRTDFTSRPSPRTDFTRPAEPRTDFTSRAGPRSDFPVVQEPRVDFTSRAIVPRTDFTQNLGLPRTDFTTARSSGGDHSGGKDSNLSLRTSLTATGTLEYPTMGREGIVMEDLGADSYPILRDDLNRDSSSISTNHAPDEYAGARSGLKISVRWIMAGLFIGLVIGIVLSKVKISTVAAQWINLPGELFTRALKCLIVPYVFCSVAVAVGDIVFVGKVSIIGKQTAKIFLIFWFSTVTMGVTVALIFRPLFRDKNTEAVSKSHPMGFTCSDKMLLTSSINGSVACATNATSLSSATTFSVVDVNKIFAKTSSGVATLTLSDQLLQVLTNVVSDNVFSSLSNSKLLSIITFSTLLGSIAGRSYFTKSRRVNYLYLTLLQLRNTLFMMMEWIIWLSPIATVSIVAGAFASTPDFIKSFGDVYMVMIATILAAALQMLIIYPLIVFLMTRTNPYSHMRHMLRAYAFAFASSSSLATMPVTLSCVKKARMCSQSVGNFVISIGVVSAISGMGWYLPIALTFLVEASGNGDELTVVKIVGVYALSLLACAGTPPIPSASLVIISTAYSTLFGTMPPTTFAYFVSMDILIDRFSTLCNVNDDIMALKIISETTDETVAQDHLGERF